MFQWQKHHKQIRSSKRYGRNISPSSETFVHHIFFYAYLWILVQILKNWQMSYCSNVRFCLLCPSTWIDLGFSEAIIIHSMDIFILGTCCCLKESLLRGPGLKSASKSTRQRVCQIWVRGSWVVFQKLWGRRKSSLTHMCKLYFLDSR